MNHTTLKLRTTRKLLLVASLLFSTHVNFAMSPLVRNLSKVSNQLSKKSVPSTIAKSLPCMLDQKRDYVPFEVVFCGIFISLQTITIVSKLNDIQDNTSKAHELLEEQNKLLKKELEIKNINHTTTQNK